jgi:hypothetical protein
VLQGVVVVQEALLRVERGIEVGELDLAEVLPSKLRKSNQAGQRVEGITSDQQVVSGSSLPDRADGSDVMQEPDFSDPVVGGVQPFVRAVLVGKQAQVLVRPGQLKPTFISGHR